MEQEQTARSQSPRAGITQEPRFAEPDTSSGQPPLTWIQDVDR